VEHMEKALERGDVKILPREKGTYLLSYMLHCQ